ncbi:MAG: peptide deformylase [Chloroflexi bacterium]|nr:peptide deformylase [Chloroflexota bacterium]MBM3154495.1 peptide deformylase [Chloroflexota bacterium]MBM3172275.1 peptide deformylase [Chloroflexota bacterium]MBM3174747.1 peptide deformylase [Chloroflexota bacterium]MBM4449838.1 peptide deformylase [Chloroflexota bacterium]
MAIRPIRVVPDPVLRQKAKRVTTIDGSIHHLVDDMIETMRAVSGVGLAATQVGVPLRVAVIEIPGEDVITIINPEVIERQGECIITEACLSVPGYQGELKRSVFVKVKAKDRYGKVFRVRGEELLAQALEHEIDHLDGVLYVDRLESPEKLWKLVLKAGEEED